MKLLFQWQGVLFFMALLGTNAALFAQNQTSEHWPLSNDEHSKAIPSKLSNSVIGGSPYYLDPKFKSENYRSLKDVNSSSIVLPNSNENQEEELPIEFHPAFGKNTAHLAVFHESFQRNQTLRIQLNQSIPEPAYVTIIDVQGTILREAYFVGLFENDELSIEVDDLPVGIYFVKASGSTWQTIQSVILN